jgi:hypothetical protein
MGRGTTTPIEAQPESETTPIGYKKPPNMNDAEARFDALIERTRQEYGDEAAESAARVKAATLHAITARPSDEPVHTDPALVDRLENADRRAEAIITRWYDSEAGRRFRWVQFLEGADDTLRAITNRALKDFPDSDWEATDLLAVSTTQGGGWRLREATTLEVIAEMISQDAACDLDLLRNTELGPCMEHHRTMLSMWRNCDRPQGIPVKCKDGLPDLSQRQYMAENFHTVPFARGNVIVLARICNQCSGAFLYRNSVDTKTIGTVEPVQDGFGSVAPGPIQRSEIAWDRQITAAHRVSRELPCGLCF